MIWFCIDERISYALVLHYKFKRADFCRVLAITTSRTAVLTPVEKSYDHDVGWEAIECSLLFVYAFIYIVFKFIIFSGIFK